MQDLILFKKEEIEEGEIFSYLQFKLIKLLKKEGPMRRGEICETLGIPWTTAYDNLEKLQKRGYIKRYRRHNDKRGAPPVFWEIIDNGNEE